MKSIVETYDLTEKALPTIPVPHDCAIREISLADGWLVLSFEENIACHESVQYSPERADAADADSPSGRGIQPARP